MDFKVGDVIKRTARSGLGYEKGKLYTVIEVIQNCVITKEHPTGLQSSKDNYVKASKLEKALK